MGSKQSTNTSSNQKEKQLTFADKKKIYEERRIAYSVHGNT